MTVNLRSLLHGNVSASFNMLCYCRTVTTAAPVPSLKIDNLLEEAVVPEMDQASKNERQRRRGSWAANGKRLTARLQQQFSRSQAAQQYSRMHGGVASPEQFQYIQGLMEAALGERHRR